MNIEKRVENLEKNFVSLIKKLNNDKFYEDADIAGVRQGVEAVTPYKETKTAYYGEEIKIFYNVPDGNISVFFSNYNGIYTVDKVGSDLIISFEALAQETDITISII